MGKILGNLCTMLYKGSVYETLQATITKMAPINFIYGSHISATEATFVKGYLYSINMHYSSRININSHKHYNSDM